MASGSFSKGSRKPVSSTAAGAPALIEYKQMKFLIINNPTPASLPNFISELERNNAKTVVRCCEPSYSANPLKEKGIAVIDLQFDDGGSPDKDIVTQWLQLVTDTFKNGGGGGTNDSIAVHCVAGLGRAPVLVAIALIERGMKYHEAVELIRSKRRGAINQKQLTYLENYKTNSKCCVM